MRAALAVPRLRPDPAANLDALLGLATDATAAGAHLVLFPEAAVTGLINNDDPAHDLPLAQEIPGPATRELGGFCRARGVWVGVGLLERVGRRLHFGGAFFVSAAGEVLASLPLGREGVLVVDLPAPAPAG